MVTAKQLINSTRAKKDILVAETPRGEIGFDNVRDDLEKVKKLREGSVEKVPANDNDIVNKLALDTAIAAIPPPDLTSYEKLDGTNQPATGNKNISKAAPEHRLTDTTAGGDYSRQTQSGTTYTQKARVKDKGSDGNYAVHFVDDGVTQIRVNVGDLSGLGLMTAGSINLWIKLDGFPHGGHPHYQMRPLQFGSPIGCYLNTVGTGIISWWTSTATVTSTGALVIGTWGMVTITWDAAATKLYLNAGIEDTKAASTVTPPAVNNWIGCATDNAYTTYGAIDEVSLWNKCLSQAEITALYNSGAGVYSAAQANLVGLWHFGEGTGTSAADSSGSGYNGTLELGPTWVEGLIAPAVTTSEINVIQAKDASTVCNGEVDIGNAVCRTNLVGYPVLPSYTTVQRDALAAVNGMIIYNSTTGAVNAYVNGAWAAL